MTGFFIPKFRLPRRQADGAALESQLAQRVFPVAEDEADVRKLVCETLEQLGYAVLQASDGHEALRILEQHGPIHLLLTDVMMR